MGNTILSKGVVTPFVVVNFAAGCIDLVPPRYFVSFNHVRTCKEACTFTLSVMYVPETFEPGKPTTIHNMLLKSKNKTVTYQYGYYDSDGRCHMQRQLYSGTFYSYNEAVDAATGTLTYNIQGVARVVEFLNERVSCEAVLGKQPSRWVRDLVTSRPGFNIISQNFDLNIDHTDAVVPTIERYDDVGLLDVLMGTTQDDGTKIGGIVALSKRALNTSEALNQGIITQEEKSMYEGWAYATSGGSTASSEVKDKYNKVYHSVRNRLYDNFVCYFDDITSSSTKCGTFNYVPCRGRYYAKTFVFEYGNNVPNSDVLSFSVTYDGAVALASCGASDTVSNNIDAAGNNVGSSNVVSPYTQLSRNIYSTPSGFKEDAFLSHTFLTSCLVYPFKATMTVMGQLEPCSLLDRISVVILINGVQHPAMTGEYVVLGVTDNVSMDGGFTTTFELERVCTPDQAANYETYVTNPKLSPADILNNHIDAQRQGNVIPAGPKTFYEMFGVSDISQLGGNS